MDDPLSGHLVDSIIDSRYTIRALEEHVTSLQADNAELQSLVGVLQTYISEAQHRLHDVSEALRQSRAQNVRLHDEIIELRPAVQEASQLRAAVRGQEQGR